MISIPPPSRAEEYADRALDCEFAIEPAFQTIACQAEAAGWSADEVSAALLALAAAHIKGIMADRKTASELRDAAKNRQ